MTDDLVKRLRHYSYEPEFAEAADRIEALEHSYASLQQAFDEMKALAAQRLEALKKAEAERVLDEQRVADLMAQVADIAAERNELLSLLQEGAAGFGRVLIATSDDKAVRNWQRRATAAIAAVRKEQGK